MASFFKRVSDVINANLNDLLDRIEDPERMLKQLIREMEDNINQAKEGVINAIASEKQLLQELENHRRQAAAWQQKAEQALAADKEDLARSALMRKKEYDAIIANLEPAWQSAQATSQRLKTQLQQLEAKLEEARRKRGTLIARQRASEAREQMHRTLDKFQSGLDAQQRFDRMEDKVAEMEARAAAMTELGSDETALDREFKQLQLDQEVEAELAALKGKLKSPAP